MRHDELAHMGVKGMKWRKGRKSAIVTGANVVTKSDSKEPEIESVFKKRQKQIANARRKAIVNAAVSGGNKALKSVPGKPKVSKEYQEELESNNKKNKYPKKMKKG